MPIASTSPLSHLNLLLLCPLRQFIFVSTTAAASRVSHPRLLVLARKRSTARFVQTYIDLGTPRHRHQHPKQMSPTRRFFRPSRHLKGMPSTLLLPP